MRPMCPKLSELGTLVGKWQESSSQLTTSSAGKDISPGLCCFSLASQFETTTCNCSKGMDVVLALLVGSSLGSWPWGFDKKHQVTACLDETTVQGWNPKIRQFKLFLDTIVTIVMVDGCNLMPVASCWQSFMFHLSLARDLLRQDRIPKPPHFIYHVRCTWTGPRRTDGLRTSHTSGMT